MELDKLILEYENDFFRKTFCDNMQNLNNRIHDEFIEFGKSGQAFNKNLIIKYLSNLDSDKEVLIMSLISKLNEDRSLKIPEEILKKAGLRPGDEIIGL